MLKNLVCCGGLQSYPSCEVRIHEIDVIIDATFFGFRVSQKQVLKLRPQITLGSPYHPLIGGFARSLSEGDWWTNGRIDVSSHKTLRDSLAELAIETTELEFPDLMAFADSRVPDTGYPRLSIDFSYRLACPGVERDRFPLAGFPEDMVMRGAQLRRFDEWWRGHGGRLGGPLKGRYQFRQQP
jgi:hypothetical protein